MRRPEKKRGCRDQCSYFKEFYDFSSLPREKQIEIEKAREDDSLTPPQYQDLLISGRSTSCLMGLLDSGRARDECRSFARHAPGLSDSDLIQLSQTKRERPWKFVAAGSAVVTVLIGFLGLAQPNEAELQAKAKRLEKTLLTTQQDLTGATTSLASERRRVQELEDRITQLEVANQGLKVRVSACDLSNQRADAGDGS